MDASGMQYEPQPTQAVSVATISLNSPGNYDSDFDHAQQDSYPQGPPINDDVDLNITQRKKKSPGLYKAPLTHGAVHSVETVKMSDVPASQSVVTPTGNRFMTTSGDQTGEDDDVCQEFQPHAWKKGICNICFRTQEEHEGKMPDISKLKVTPGGGGLEKRLEQAIRRIADLEGELRDVTEQYSNLKSDYKDLDEDCMAKDEELKCAVQESEDIVKTLKQKVERLDDENHYLKKKIDDLQPKSIKSIGRGKWK